MSTILTLEHLIEKKETPTPLQRVLSFLGKRNTLKQESDTAISARTECRPERKLLQRAATVYVSESEGFSKGGRRKSSIKSRRSIPVILSIGGSSGGKVLPSVQGLNAAAPSKQKLQTPCSMSFPLLLRSKSQPVNGATDTACAVQISMPMLDGPNPWGRAKHCDPAPLAACAFASDSDKHRKMGRIDSRRSTEWTSGPSERSLSVSFADSGTASETSVSSDDSYATCHSLFMDEGSEAQSTPTMLSSPPMMSYTVANNVAFTKALDGDYTEETNSVEDWGNEPEGLAIDDLDEKVMTFICSDQPGRQARLRQYSSGDFAKAVAFQEEDADKMSDPKPLSASPTLKYKLSLNDFLNELRTLPPHEEVVCGDESFESSVMDDEEADSIQICRAWRESIAFANLGASHPNQPFEKASSLKSPNGNTTPSKRTLRNRLSRVSLKAISLETIEEVAATTHGRLRSAPPSPPSEADTLGDLSLCAHLLKRAKADMVSRNSV